jgi:hypothetical protein
MLRIGIDFDNTLACYDNVFEEISYNLGYTKNIQNLTKVEVKENILASNNGELKWQRIQGKVYGKYMHLAKAYDGVYEFICLAKIRGYKVFIVSHKSEFGHFDDEKISLRNQALLWMEKNGFLNKSGNMLELEDIYFESTRLEKINRINSLGCTHFIDDLKEILLDKHFNNNTKKILFYPNKKNLYSNHDLCIKNSWSKIINNILGIWCENDLTKYIKISYPELNIKNLITIRRGANSKVYRLNSKDEKSYILKIYPDLQYDNRPRLANEYKSLTKLYLENYPVPKPVVKIDLLNWGIYEWIEGSTNKIIDENFLNESIKFLTRLSKDSKTIFLNANFNKASEACLSGMDIEKQIVLRINNLKKVQDNDLFDYIENELTPIALSLINRAKKLLGPLYISSTTNNFLVLSPSDFGAHNSIKSASRTVFIDFEYFGFDDPVKLVSDFYWHPGMIINEKLKDKWLHSTNNIFKKDPEYMQRLNANLPLFGIRWSLIILNKFIELEKISSFNTINKTESNLTKDCFVQLNKSKELLKKIRKKYQC